MKKIMFLFSLLALFLFAACVPEEEGVGVGKAVQQNMVSNVQNNQQQAAQATLVTTPAAQSAELLVKNDFSNAGNELVSFIANPSWEVLQGEAQGRIGYYWTEQGKIVPSIADQLEMGGIAYSNGGMSIHSPIRVQQKASVFGNQKYALSITLQSIKTGNFFGIIQYNAQGNIISPKKQDFTLCDGSSEVVSGTYKCSIDEVNVQSFKKTVSFTTDKNTVLVAVVFGNEEKFPPTPIEGTFLFTQHNQVMVVKKISLYGPKVTPGILPEAKVTAYVRRGDLAPLDDATSGAAEISYRPVYTLVVQAAAKETPIDHIVVYNPQKGRARYYSCASKTCTIQDSKWPSLSEGDKTAEGIDLINFYFDGSYAYPDYYLAKQENYGDVCSKNSCSNAHLKVQLFFMNGASETITLRKENNFYFDGDSRQDTSTGQMPTTLTKPVDHIYLWEGTFSPGCACTPPTSETTSIKIVSISAETVQAIAQTAQAATPCPKYEPVMSVISKDKAKCACVEKT